MRLFIACVFLVYTIAITVLSYTSCREAYWPIIVGASTAFILVASRFPAQSKPLVATFFALCLATMASQFLLGTLIYKKLSFEDFLESQLWLLIYFYLPLLALCFITTVCVRLIKS